MASLKNITILHSNDMHGDFMAKEVDSHLIGGVSMLSGYINKVRQEEENVIYAIAGDMFRGSLIDSEFKGMSTIEIVNLLAPDVVTLGNHEVDYGLSHLLFIEKCARFPIINANMYLTTNYTRLFRSHLILDVDGMKILFIGVLTEEVLNQTRQEKLIGSVVDIEEAASEVGKICNAYRTEDIDFTVLLTHIGFEADKKLASLLDPVWGVDIIIGGHSHTLMQQPEVINGIPIVQAAVGTDQIGRFDITVDMDNNCIHDYSWKLIPITEQNCPRDPEMEDLILHYKEQTDRKYNRILTRLPGVITHPARNQETEMGRFFADAIRSCLSMDIILLGSGSIRKTEMDPVLRYRDLVEIMPYDEPVYRLVLTGKQLRHMITFILRDEAFKGTTEFYQFSKGMKIVYDRKQKKLVSLQYNGKEVEDDRHLRVGIQRYHFCNLQEFLDVSLQEISLIHKPRVITTSTTDVLVEYLSLHEKMKVSREQRLFIIE